MLHTRFSHTATLLEDGRVLLAGGYGPGSTTLSAAEIFDPATRTFMTAGSMSVPRSDHVAVRLNDGRVLIMGGLGPNWTFLASAEIYDPATGTFTPTGNMSVPRESHVGVLLNDGTVLVVGGHKGRRSDMVIHTSAEVYDPARGIFTPAGDMAVRRHKHDAVLVSDGRVLVTGGSDERDDRGVYQSTELYDPLSRTFSPGPRLRLGRFKHARSSIPLPDGRVLLAGGGPQAEVFDQVEGGFRVIPGDVRMAGQFSASALLNDGQVLITGGYGNNISPTASAWMFRP
jgi:hypothetical protein